VSAPTIELTVWTDQGDEVELAIPAKFELCPRCRGAGSHVNPAIDGNGISPEEFRDDPDFEEAYFRGDYDVSCERCEGEKVIKVIDREKATEAELQLFDIHQRELDDMRREEEAERRVGA
jgi:hypothetical protein